MDWQSLLEKLTTESILSYLADLDPLSLATNPFVVVPGLVFLAGLFFFRMLRTLVVVLGLFALWVGVAYMLPQETEICLQSIGGFVGICLAVAAVWIYFFFVRGD